MEIYEMLNEGLNVIKNSMWTMGLSNVNSLLQTYGRLEVLVNKAFNFNCSDIAYKAQDLQNEICGEINKRINGGM